MKKGQVVEGIIERVDFPNRGILRAEDGKQVVVKNSITGQKVSAVIQKARKGKCEGRLLEILEKSPLELKEPGCIHYGVCGGCTFQSLPYEEQLSMKERQVKTLLDEAIVPENRDYAFLPSSRAPERGNTATKWNFPSGTRIRTGRSPSGCINGGAFMTLWMCRNVRLSMRISAGCFA